LPAQTVEIIKFLKGCFVRIDSKRENEVLEEEKRVTGRNVAYKKRNEKVKTSKTKRKREQSFTCV
jgi:hypothetical protein